MAMAQMDLMRAGQAYHVCTAMPLWPNVLLVTDALQWERTPGLLIHTECGGRAHSAKSFGGRRRRFPLRSHTHTYTHARALPPIVYFLAGETHICSSATERLDLMTAFCEGNTAALRFTLALPPSHCPPPPPTVLPPPTLHIQSHVK